jgi:hypothetical protein
MLQSQPNLNIVAVGEEVITIVNSWLRIPHKARQILTKLL